MYVRDSLVKIISDCCWKIWKVTGPGFEEQFYKKALTLELEKLNIDVNREYLIKMVYDGHDLGDKFLDLFVGGRMIVEAKAIGNLSSVHYKQLRNYLKAADREYGILVNFGSSPLQFRIVLRDFEN